MSSGPPIPKECKALKAPLAPKLDEIDNPSQVAPAKQTSAARRQIEPALYPQKVATVQPIKGGISGAYVFRVTTEDGRVYCAKVVLSLAKIAFPAVMKSEHRNYAWAAEHSLAPGIAFSDPETGLLITDFCTNEMADWYDGGKEPRLSASLDVMRALHSAKPPVRDCHYSAENGITLWEGKFCKLSSEKQQAPFARLADLVARACIVRLSKQVYDAVPCHGDFHQGNVIYNTGKAWLIDWGDLEVSDPMKEVAYFAYSVDANLDRLNPLLERYDPLLAQEDKNRATYYLALLQASRYLLTLRDMEWETKMWRENRLPILERYLLEGAKLLGLDGT